jgi:IclR family transcriptional regulator, pca regulon regulatory protein
VCDSEIWRVTDIEALVRVDDASDEPTWTAGGFVQSLERGLAVIKAFDAEHASLTVSDVARIAGIPRAAARRFLHTLVELGYMSTEGRTFTLRPKVLELGHAYLSALTLPEIATPRLRELSTAVRESSYLTVLDGYETICVAQVPVRRIWTLSLTIGTKLPALATAAGRAILASQSDEWLDRYLSAAHMPRITSHTITNVSALRAELAAISERGWALVDQELEEGLRTFAAPIHDSQGKVVAAVSFSTLASAVPTETSPEALARPLLDCRSAIEADLEFMSARR